MLAYFLRRAGFTPVVILGLSLLNFFLLFMLPGDAAEMLAIYRYGAADAGAEAIERIKREEGLDKPFPIQYAAWLWGALRGDLGKSRVSGEPVLKELERRMPATLELAMAGLAISLAIGLPCGIMAALKKNSSWDYLLTWGSLVGASIPNFWLGLILILFLGVHLNLFPTFGQGSFSHLVLPACTLGVSMAGITARLTRSSVLDVLGQEYIKTAKSKGLPKMVILFRHVMKNALIPVVTIAAIQFGHLLEGTVVVETVFAWPGIGRLLMDAIHNRDYPLIQGCVLYIAFIFCLLNYSIDMLHAFLDPRVRLNARD